MTFTQNLDQTIKLQDGRTLGYAELGQQDGFPIFYFHGGNGSRLEAKWFTEAVENHPIRLIAPDRPGFGLSDFQPDRTFLDWAKDVQELANALDIERFSIFGLSGGAPHVAAVAHALPEQIHRAGIVSGVAPSSAPNRFKGMFIMVRVIFLVSQYLPPARRFVLGQMSRFYSDADMMRKRMLQAMPQPDKDLIQARPEIIDIFAEDAREAHRNGIKGDDWEWHLYVNDWGFDIADISVETGLWYGKYDTQATAPMGEYYANTLPHNTFRLVEDGGHFSTINNHIDAILNFLTP